MRTLVVSDLHLGARTDIDLLRRPALREPLLDELREFLVERVPKWWIPNDLELIDEVPKTSVGKFSKKTLRERFGGA